MSAVVPDPIDVAGPYPRPPAGLPAPARVTATGPTPSASHAEVVLAAEHLRVGTEWTVSGGVRFRRRIRTYTRSLEVQVRREELEIQVRDIAERGGAWVGTAVAGEAVAPPESPEPTVLVLREEVPRVEFGIRAYEQVSVAVERVVEQVEVREVVRREQAQLVGDTGAPHPPQHR